MGKRMYCILKIIQEARGVGISGADIVKELEKYDIYINIKTVHSCVKHINEFFYEWLNEDMIVAIRKNGYRIQCEYFDDGELQFLLDSVAFHQDLRDEDKHILKEKLLLLSSYHQQSRLVDFHPTHKDLSFSLFLNLSTIMKAIENKNMLSFQYINYEVKNKQLKEVPSQNGNNKEEYLISPYQIVSNNNHYYLIGYNEKYKNQLTTYRIDRMRYIKTTRHHFIEMREQYDMRDVIEKTTNMYLESHRDTLKIECHQKLLREVASHFGKNIKVEKLYQEHYLITIEDIPISEGLIGWIMMLQDQIKVISPLSLQDEMKKEFKTFLIFIMIKSVFFFLVVYNRSRGEKMKLLASDVDNTLLFDGKYIKEEDVKKIKEFQEKGHVFGVCTGRNLEGVVKPSQPYHIDYDFYIVLSGALIFNKKEEIIFEKKMPMSLIEDIFLSLNKQHATIVCPDKMYRISSDGFNDEFCEVISSLKDIPYEYVNSISFHFEKDEIEKAREATEFLKEKFQGQIEVFQNNEHIDIAMQGCSKGNGLKMIQEYFHIHEDNLFCIGDSWNDLPMFQECKHPYTFTYAPEDVKEKAEEIVESLAECIEDIMK